jgi:ligand-binding sensor domain-containing protein
MPNDNPSRRCFSITKTPDGFIWYLSEDGICRYDGKFAKLYPIKVSWSGFLRVDNNGNLILVTSEGDGYQYNASKDKFDKFFQVCYSSLDSIIEIPKENEIPTAFPVNKSMLISSISFDFKNRIWLGVKEGALCFNPQTKSWRLIKSKSSDYPVVNC